MDHPVHFLKIPTPTALPPYLRMLVAGPALLSVGLHDAAEVRRLVGDVLQVGLEELRQDGDGALGRELLQRVQRPVVQVGVFEFTCGGESDVLFS